MRDPVKRRASQAAYDASAKGRARHRRFNHSAKGRARNKSYDARSVRVSGDRVRVFKTEAMARAVRDGLAEIKSEILSAAEPPDGPRAA